MNTPRTSTPSTDTSEGASSVETAVQHCVAARLKFWGLAAGLPLLFVLGNTLLLLFFQTRQVTKLTRELETLKAESVRFGHAVEIYNPAWGTVIDAVDPSRFPSRDARDPRYGALVQQYMPRGNIAQIWHLRPPSTNSDSDPPLPVQAYIKHAFSFLSARDFNRAIQSFEHCIKIYPDAAAAHSGLAMAQRDKGDFVQALASHDMAVGLEPGRHEYRWERGITRLRAGDADGAIKDCQSVLEQNADFADACNTMGLAYRSKGDYAEALKHHDRAVELNPQREDFWRERGVTYGASGDQQKAAADSARAQELRQARR